MHKCKVLYTAGLQVCHEAHTVTAGPMTLFTFSTALLTPLPIQLQAPVRGQEEQSAQQQDCCESVVRVHVSGQPIAWTLQVCHENS